MSIVLIGDLTEAAYASWNHYLASQLPPEETLVLAPRCTDKQAVDIALAANPPWGELATYPNLRFVQSLWAGVDRLLGDPALPQGIPVARLIDPNMAQAMVEAAMAATLFLHRQFPAYQSQQHTHTWCQLPQPVAAQRNLAVLGFGQMGEPAARALAALGFRVHAWGQQPRAGTAPVNYSWGPAGLDAALSNAEIVLNLLPLTATTTGILNTALFERLPHGAALINLGRGKHLEETDLLTALDSGRLSHAVLDVFLQEPLPADHPFWSHPRITVFPHIAATTDPASAAAIAARNIAAFRAGEPVTGLVSRLRGY